jgi:tetratricopeptide (TPR) repeat protein
MRSAALALLLLSATAVARAEPGDAWRLSYAAEARGDHAAALAALEKAGGGPVAYVLALRRGWLLHLAGRHADAVASYQQALALEPRAVEARLGAMLPLMALRRWKDAERLGEEALAIAPGDPTTRARLAWIDYSQAQWQKAEQRYREALAAWPASAELRTGLGWSLLKQGKHREARAELERVLTFAPDHAPAREGLALVP